MVKLYCETPALICQVKYQVGVLPTRICHTTAHVLRLINTADLTYIIFVVCKKPIFTAFSAAQY